MKKNLLSLIATVLASMAHAQNVGIGTITPSQKLDVNGNVNIAGTIMANGIAGSSGQMLISTGSGLTWGSSMGYKKCVMLTSSSGTWTVPAGVTEVMVEVWGAGAGGTESCGGPGGGYARTVQSVIPGNSISYTVGTGGAGSVNSSSNGGNITVTSASGGVLTAYGGTGCSGITSHGSVGSGLAQGAISNYYFAYGNYGTSSVITAFSDVQNFANGPASYLPVANNYEITTSGSGGVPIGYIGGAAAIPGDFSEQFSHNFPASNVYPDNYHTIIQVNGSNAFQPGAGGPAGATSGYYGGPGMVIIWWN